MKKPRSVISGLLVTIIMLSLFTSGYAAPGSGSDTETEITSVPSATLRAASGATIRFKTHNGETIDGAPPQTLDLPYLVLHRNGALTDPDERTLIVEVTGIEVPSPGVTVTLQVETQHGDPDLGRFPSDRIPVWREAQWIANTSGFTQAGAAVVFTHEFDETVVSGAEAVATPTDYFRYDVAVIDASHLLTNPLHASGEEYAFLMESQWIARLPEVQEESPGAAPDELIVHYCDMFPFRRDVHYTSTWIPRQDVPAYIRSELIPAMVEAFRVQSDEWGFPWYQAWTSYRPEEHAERVSVALSEGQTWFHGKAPYRGHSGISINLNARHNATYDTLTDGLMSNFHHELFHNHQRNINQNNGGNGIVDGAEEAWQFFSEGTAVLASSVGQSDVQFGKTLEPRDYVSHVNGFVGGSELLGNLRMNRSLEITSPYYAGIYWRFLYEQCGGLTQALEDPSAGMGIIRRTLTVLYSKETVDIDSSTDLVKAIPEIMNRAFASPEASACPFDTYEDSLIHFARALYALRLEGGRCTEPGTPAGCGFYDPENLYRDPSVSKITYRGTPVTYTVAHQLHPAGISNSYGMDFIDVILYGNADGRSLAFELYGAPGAAAEFAVQVWELKTSGEGPRPQPALTQGRRFASLHPRGSGPTILKTTNTGGALSTVVPAIDTTEYNRLGLIITRVDANERLDPVGEYTIVLRPVESEALATALYGP